MIPWVTMEKYWNIHNVELHFEDGWIYKIDQFQ